jgi:hypothetical protein
MASPALAPSITRRRSGAREAGTSARPRPVMRPAMPIALAAAVAQSYVGCETASSSTSSPIRLAHSKNACSLPWSL